MMQTLPSYVVIVAGGSGLRMGAAMPKQFITLNGRPVIYYSIRAFLDALEGAQIILVAPEAQFDLAVSIADTFEKEASIKVVVGGDTRFASVSAGLKEVPKGALVMVHDGARPLVSTNLIHRCYECASLNNSAIPVIPLADSIREVSSYGSRAIARDNLRIVQTPQAFSSTLLHEAFAQDFVPSFTDEASVVEWMGGTVQLVEGQKSNIKITTPEDLVIAEALLKQATTPV
jgi:2-C-methyl-D-erythritol 4-phosphate cytidylyltransferase